MGAIVTRQGNGGGSDIDLDDECSLSDVKQVKQTLVGKLRTKIMRSNSMIRTRDALQGSSVTPVKMMLVDPRSPGIMAGDRGVERTPLLAIKKEDKPSMEVKKMKILTIVKMKKPT